MPAPIYQTGQSATDYLNEVIQSRPDREEQYKGALSQMKDAYAKRSVEGDDAAQWAALAKGFAKPAENFWQALANAGGAKADVVADIEARDLGLGREAAMANYEMAGDLLKQDDMLTRAMATRAIASKTRDGGVITRQQPDGTVIVLDKNTGAEIRRYDPLESRQFQTFFTSFMEQSKNLDTVLPEERVAWAHQRAMEAVDASRAAVGNRSAAPGSPNAQPTPVAPMPMPGQSPQATTPMPAAPSQPQPVVAMPQGALDVQGTAGKVSVDFRGMTLPQLMEAYGRVPERERPAFLAALSNARTQPAQQPAQQPVPVPPTSEPGGLRFKDAETEAERSARGTARGKSEFDAYTDFQKQGMAAADLTGQLNIMKELFIKHGDDIPSGELAPYIAGIKSALGSVGIQMAGTGAADIINSIGTMGALKARTADGQNMMPGQMSNFDAQLLQKVFPQLSRSKEGRILQIEIMQAQLRTRAEIAEAARDWYGKHKTFGPGWDDYAIRIMQRNPFYDPDRIAALEERAKRLANQKGTKR